MKVLVTGVKGQLGFDVMRELKERGMEGIGVDIEEMDITDAASVDRVVAASRADAVIHCAAYTAVDAAEEHENACRRVNVDGTRNIAAACGRLSIRMLYVSTDYVFDGEGEEPWKPEDERKPLNVYGRTKYEGELAVQEALEQYFIVRTAWVFGRNGSNFIKTMLRLAGTGKVLEVVNDQFGSPTYTYDLSALLVDMIQTEKYGIYHATNEGFCTWYEFACEVFRQAGMVVEVKPVASEQFPVKARRPYNSRMDKGRLEEYGFHRLPDWKDAVRRYLKEIEAAKETT